jgi:glycosyltransferase involved in cell wall biosynthesis
MDLVMAPGERPLISVIIASYNYAHYISESISSVLTQDVPSLELIVVDNASTDNTDEVVARFSGDSRLRYYKNPTNIGLAPNHNRGLELARGKYILFVSADDKLLPGHLRRCYDYLEAHPAIDMVYTGVVFINAESRPFGIRNMNGQLPVDYEGGRNEFAAQLAEGCYVPWPSMLARRSLYDELGPLHLMTAADYEITVRWSAARKAFAYLRTPSVCIRLHGPQASGSAYVAEGRDLVDYLDILDKFVVPDNWDLLQGFQTAITAHLAWRTSFYRQTSGSGGSPEIAARVDELTGRLASIPSWLPGDHLNGRPLITVIMRIGTVPQVLAGLESLAAQQDAPPWEAVVVGENGPDLGPLLRAQPYADRVRFVRMDERDAPAAARNLGHRLAAGRIITYLEPGNAFAPQHFANLARAFATGAQTVRSEVRFLLAESHDGTPNTIFRETVVAGLFRGAGDEDRDLIAATVPVDAIAHVAGTLARTGGFRVDLPAGDVWEFWLRLRSIGGTLFVPGPTVDVHTLRQNVLPHAAYAGIAQSIYRAYPAADGSTLAARRVTYLNAIGPHFERGAAAIVDQTKAIEVLAALLGIENAVLTPST